MMVVYPIFLVYVVSVWFLGSTMDSSMMQTCLGPGTNRSPQRGKWLVFVNSRFVYRWPVITLWLVVSSVRTWVLQYQHNSNIYLTFHRKIYHMYLARLTKLTMLAGHLDIQRDIPPVQVLSVQVSNFSMSEAMVGLDNKPRLVYH